MSRQGRAPGTAAKTAPPPTVEGGEARSSARNGLRGVQHAAGNQALQRHLRAGTLQARLAVGASSDPFEQEADRMAEQVVRGKSAPCHDCRTPSGPVLQRKSSDSSPPDAPPVPGRGGAQPLDASTRADMERHFGHDFGGVRVHTGPQADRSTRLLNARAYTFGEDIVFSEGGYQPATDDGKNLLAHELTHVVQQEGAPKLQRSVQGDVRHMSIGPQWAQALTDQELVEQHALLQNYLLSLTKLLAGTPEYLAAEQNIAVLETEQRARVLRQAGFGAPPGPTIARPPGLPLMEGFALQLMPELPLEVMASIPEGQIVTLTPDALLGLGGPSGRTTALEGAGGGAFAGLRGANAALMSYGFASAGDFAVGLVALPPANLNPLSANFNPIDLAAPLERAGHTAVYVRQGGKITIVRGYNPQMSTPSSFMEVALNQGEIFSGKAAVPGEITADAALFKSTAARTIEFPVTPEVAAQLVKELPPLGTPAPGQPPLYTAPPAEYARITGTQPGCVGTNCGLWAAQQLEGATGGRIGIAGEPPIVDVPVPGQASQGKLYGMMGRVQEGAPVAEMPGAKGPAVGGGMSTGMKYLKWGGRVFLVGSIGKVGYDVWTAPPEEKAHVAVVGGAGIAGGFAAGAALGLVCGPGAPVCSIVTGIVGGILGGIGAGTAAEFLWHVPEAARGLYWMMGHENPESKEYYEREERKQQRKSMGLLTEDDV